MSIKFWYFFVLIHTSKFRYIGFIHPLFDFDFMQVLVYQTLVRKCFIFFSE